MQNIIDSFVSTFTAATLQTMEIQCEISLKPNLVEVRNEPQAFEVGGLIGIQSPKMRGSAALFFSKSTFLKILEKFSREPVKEINSENEDTAAELLNIIFSQVKSIFNKDGHQIEMAIPNLLRGEEIQTYYPKGQTIHTLSFQFDQNQFFAELAFEDQNKPEFTQKSQATLTDAGRTEIVETFVRSTIETFKIQCNLEIQKKQIAETAHQVDSTRRPLFDIAGIVGLTSQNWVGSFMLGFKREVYLKLANGVYSGNIGFLQPALDDLSAELVNITLGLAKKSLSQKGHKIHMAIPATLRGKMIESSLPQGRKSTLVYFSSPIGDLYIQMSLV